MWSSLGTTHVLWRKVIIFRQTNPNKWKKGGEIKLKKYNSLDSLVVSYLTTKQLVCGFNLAKRFVVIW
jgi:hypothetical protein